jgi:hypothetical protein
MVNYLGVVHGSRLPNLGFISSEGVRGYSPITPTQAVWPISIRMNGNQGYSHRSEQLGHEEDIGLHLVPRSEISGTLPPGMNRQNIYLHHM